MERTEILAAMSGLGWRGKHTLLLSRDGDRAGALDLVRDLFSPAINPSIKAQFAGQLADRLDRTEEAIRFYEDMNAAQAQSPMGVGVDRSAYQRAIAALDAQTTAAWFAEWAAPPQPADRPAPAFLVGFPRSGTTLLDTILMGRKTYEFATRGGGGDSGESKIRTCIFSRTMAEAPAGAELVRDDAAGFVRSPYTVGGKQRLFAEPPHMQASMLFLPSGAPVPEVGDEVDVRVRYTATSFDETVVS